MTPKVSQRIQAWGLALGWVLLIFSTLGSVRGIDRWLKQFPFYSLLIIFACLIFILSLIMLFKPLKPWQGKHIVAVTSILCLYGLTILKLPIPAEQIHLPQYGLCFFLYYRALCLDMPWLKALSLALGLATLSGLLDELIQMVTPGRYFGWNDVLLNAWAALLAAALIASAKIRK